MNIRWLIYLIISSSVCTVLVHTVSLYKPAKFPYSKCTQNANTVTCEALHISKEIRAKKSVWPPGPFAIPMTKFGCPEAQSRGWSTGVMTIKSGYGYMALAERFSKEPLISQIDRNVWHLQGDPYSVFWKLKFCVKLKRNPDLDTGTWIPGNYNIYMNGNTCPEGFAEFSRTRFFSEHTVHGDVPNFALGKKFGIDYMNVTMCERISTNRESEGLPQHFKMLETVFMLEKKRNSTCPQFNKTLITEVTLLDDVENKYCLYTPDQSPDDTGDVGKDSDKIIGPMTESKRTADTKRDELGLKYAEVTSGFNISKGSFPPTVKQIRFENTTYLRQGGDFLKTENRRLIWYHFDLKRTLTVSKVEIVFNLYKTKHSKMAIIDNIPFIICYYDDVTWSFLDLEAPVCNVETKYISNTLHLFMRDVHGRFITLVFEKLNGFQLTMLGQSVRVFILDTQTLGGELCNEDLGMIDGNIRDFQISASSWRRRHLPSNARPSSSGWCAQAPDKRPWILVDLFAITTVEGVRIYNLGWSHFTIYFGTEVQHLQLYNKAIFSPGRQVHTFMLPTPLKARYIKLEVRKGLQAHNTCLKFELLGCKLSGIPSLNCHNASEMSALATGITTQHESIVYNISSNEDCNSLCLQSDNCSISKYSAAKSYCVQYKSSTLDNWRYESSTSGSWSAKLCTRDPVELFPTFRDRSGTVLTNVEVIETAALITTVGYPFTVGSGQQYKWIVKFADNHYIKMIFTNVSLGLEMPGTHSSCDRLFISKDIKSDTAGKAIDNSFNDRIFVIETAESVLVLTFASCCSEKVIICRGFRAVITEEEIAACLSINSEIPWREGRKEICNRHEMVLTSMSILNLPFVNEERWDIQAGEHNNVQFHFLDFYVLCANEPGELRSTFRVIDHPDRKMFCNTDMPPNVFYSQNSDVTIVFRKYEEPKRVMVSREGFRLRYKTINHSFGGITDLRESKPISKVCFKAFNKCYTVFSSLMSWTEAEGLCRSKRQMLVSIQSSNELQYIHYLLREKMYREKRLYAKNRKAYNTSIVAHIGLRRLENTWSLINFEWQNTAPISFSAWSPGHPTQSLCTRTNFQYFNTDSSWESEDCYDSFAQHFICETQMDSRKRAISVDTGNDNLDTCGIAPNKHFNINVTYSGKACQQWGFLSSDANADFGKRFGNLPHPITASNYCQDPSSDGVLWCYTTHPDILWETCVLQQPLEFHGVETAWKNDSHQYICGNGTAIPTINRCDGIFDCSDYSDETLCSDIIKDHFLLDNKEVNNIQNIPTRLEIGSYFRCGTKEWISIIAKCDGFIDCLDASDEVNCNRTDGGCNEDEFSCADGNCIHVSQVCDFISDCENAEDEFCEHGSCGFDEFLCRNKQCIPNNKRCNAIPDCIDKTDEWACESCKDSWTCGKMCLQPKLKCDRVPDCYDKNDETNCAHDEISSCEQWWELGYHRSGPYIIDDIAVECDFSSLNIGSQTITMKIRNIDLAFGYNHDNGALFTRSADGSKLILNEYKTNGNKFKDMIYRANYECVLKVKSDCHLPESEVSVFEDPYRSSLHSHCQCTIEELKAEKKTYMKAVYERPFGQLRRKRATIRFRRQSIRYRHVTEFVFRRLNFTHCNGSKISPENGSNNVYYRVNSTNSFHVDSRILQKELPVDIRIGPITCSYEYSGFKTKEQIYCEGENRTIPRSMLCVYDTDASGRVIGCRSGNSLQNCGDFDCPHNTVKCPNSYCIPLRFICDGRIQCPRGEDEQDCTCTESAKEILILTDSSGSNIAISFLARQLSSTGSVIRVLYFKAKSQLKGRSIDDQLLDIYEEHKYPFESVKGVNTKHCRYKSTASNVLQSITFSNGKSKGIVFIENSMVSSRVAEIMFSNFSHHSPVFRVFKTTNSLHKRPYRYKHVKDIPVNKWSSLFSLAYKRFPEICKAGLQVPCLGGYRCSSSKQCLPLEQLCDGIVHCINGDDERLCDFKCPEKCRCVGQVINCRSVNLHELKIRALPINTRSIDLSQNPRIRKILHQGILRFPFMLKLNLSSCEIESVSKEAFSHLYNLRSLDIGYNKLTILPENLFSNLVHLTELNLDGNFQLTVISSSAFHGLRSINSLRITGTKLKLISAYTFSGLKLQSINISHNKIEEIEDYSFSNISVRCIDFTGNQIVKFNKLIFTDVSSLRELRTPAYKFCCIRPCYVDENDCFPTKNEFSSCGDLMRHPVLQATLWIVGIAALTGNIGSIIYRLVYDRERLKIGYGIFVTNLAAADFLMGVYLIIIATIDSLYRKRYIYMDDQWRNSNLCVTAGILSTVSSEASVLFLCLITLDRLLVIKYPFGTIRFGPKRAYICCCFSWISSLALALIPVFYTGYFENRFYSRSAVCIALPLTRDKPPGWIYSVSIFVGLNFCTFILVAFGQLLIFRELRKTTSGLQRTQKSRKRDLQVARNLILVATTDFLCWFPIGLMGIMALNGHPISGDMYAWTAVFILPFNSALNPVLYTLTAIIGKRSFNPSTEEQSRTEIQKEVGSGILHYQQINRSVRMKCDISPVGNILSVEDILQNDRHISVVYLTAIASQLATFLQVLHESSIALEKLNESNTYLGIDEKKRKKIIVVIDSKTMLISDKRLIHENMHQYGILLRKLLEKCNKCN